MKRGKEGNRSNSLLKNKKGELLNVVIFIVLTLLYLAMMFYWVSSKGKGAVLLEQAYAKNIALLIDASQPKMEMKLNMEKAFDLAKKEKLDFDKKEFDQMVTINDNAVTVKLSKNGGYTYYFFNDITLVSYPLPETKEYYMLITGYKNN